MDGFNRTEISLLCYLFGVKSTKDNQYLQRLAKAVGKTPPATLDGIKKLKKKGLIHDLKVETRELSGPTRYYFLTELGEAYARAFLYPNELLALYKK